MGGARTALFNYLFAKQQKGVFVLRIEDTDKERSKKEWEEDILEHLSWLGLDWDEGPGKEGKYGPYRQSERTELYKKYLLQLLEQKQAYYCFCKPEDLEAQRQDQMSRGEAPRYLGTCRNLSQEEQETRLKAGESAVIRFMVPAKKVSFQDLVRGTVEFDAGLAGDMVVAKDLNTPLYNFTVVVDDHEMNITHVIRGEDHIPNTPKQILLQEALGLPRLAYGHLPLLLGPDRTKLSKRHGDHSVAQFMQEGYLPEAIINFLALLGWNPGTERETFSLTELAREFSLERVQKGGAIFNVSRLDWLNGWYIRQKSTEEVAELCAPYLVDAGLLGEKEIDIQKLAKIVALYRERLKKLSEIVELVDFFFVEKLSYDKDLLLWKDATREEIRSALKKAEDIVRAIEEKDWNEENITKLLMPEAEKEKNRGYMLWPFRVALCGKKASAGPFEIATVLGKQKTISRVQEAEQLLI